MTIVHFHINVAALSNFKRHVLACQMPVYDDDCMIDGCILYLLCDSNKLIMFQKF